MIIFEKFGGGQAERKCNVPVSSDHSMGSSTLLALAKDGTKEGTKEGSRSQTRKRLSRSTLAPPSAASQRGGISVSLHCTRVAGPGPRMSGSNRELELLERGLSHCKQRLAIGSNRELWTVCDFAASSRLMRDSTVILRRGSRSAGRGSRPPGSFLTETGSQTEFAVTRSKQTATAFLTETRIAHFGERPAEKRRAQAVHATTFENRMLPGPGVLLWTQSAARYNAYTNHNEIISFRSEL
jgi:hypothetical protein